MKDNAPIGVRAIFSGPAVGFIKGTIRRRSIAAISVETLVMKKTSRSFLVAIAASLLACGFGAPLQAQQAGNQVMALPQLIAPDPQILLDPTPREQLPIDPRYEWNHSRTNANRAGSVNSTHQGYTSEDGNTYAHRHIVANPSGQMTQTRERTYDGESYTQNRERNRLFRDGRTMEMTQTRSWDAESGTGTVSRSFLGPNGQSQGYERPWSPEGEMAGSQASFGPDGPKTLEAPQRPDRGIHNMWGLLGSTKKSKPKSSFWNKLNPFRHKEKSMTGPEPSPRRSGFTLGSAAQQSVNPPRYGLAKKQAGQAQVKAGGSKLSHQLRLDARPPHPVRLTERRIRDRFHRSPPALCRWREVWRLPDSRSACAAARDTTTGAFHHQ